MIADDFIRTFGLGANTNNALTKSAIFLIPGSYLSKLITQIAQNGMQCIGYHQLFDLDNALQYFSENDFDLVWTKSHLTKLCEINNRENGDASSNAAELISYGLLKKSFNEIQVIPVKKKAKTADFKLTEDLFVEVYCPQPSPKEAKKTADLLDKMAGPVKLCVSHPLTGSDGKSLEFPTNKIIDRVVNSKRNNDQTVVDVKNILWLDLLNGFQIDSKKIMPFESVNSKGLTWFGCFGVWHSFYGEKAVCKFPKERYTLQFPDSGNHYYQIKNGIFRERKNLSAAIIMTKTGISVFENPWASRRLERLDLEKISTIPKFNPESSFFDIPETSFLEVEIQAIINKLNWLIR